MSNKTLVFQCWFLLTRNLLPGRRQAAFVYSAWHYLAFSGRASGLTDRGWNCSTTLLRCRVDERYKRILQSVVLAILVVGPTFETTYQTFSTSTTTKLANVTLQRNYLHATLCLETWKPHFWSDKRFRTTVAALGDNFALAANVGLLIDFLQAVLMGGQDGHSLSTRKLMVSLFIVRMSVFFLYVSALFLLSVTLLFLLLLLLTDCLVMIIMTTMWFYADNTPIIVATSVVGAFVIVAFIFLFQFIR